MITKHVSRLFTVEDLLQGGQIIHDVTIPAEILNPGSDEPDDEESGTVRLRPLTIATVNLITKAARDDAALIPLLMIKEGLVEPTVTLNQVHQMPIGLVHFLVSQINIISGLDADGEALTAAVHSPLGRAHILLAKHFGWSPEQVSQLTPGQVAVYLAGIERLLSMEQK